MTRAKPRACPICADLKRFAKAVRAAEKRVEASDPMCPCHSYHRSFCIAEASRVWWTPDRVAEQKAAKEALAAAVADFDAAITDLAAVA